MTREMTWMGLLATLLIVVVLGVVALREPERQTEARTELRVEAVLSGTDRYAENCAVCHGAQGEGLGATPALNSAGVREMDYADVFKTIERGRYNTNMAAYAVHEGGIFTNAQIDSLVAVVQYADWAVVEARVAELGLTPPQPVVVELTDETLQMVRALPEGEQLASGLELFVTECAACHGGNAEGTTLAPALNNADLRATKTDADLTRIVEQGVPGTLMAGWSRALTSEAVADVILLIRRWDELEAAGIEMPVIETPEIDMSPEAVAQGQWLFDLMCTQCHGTGGYGSPMAPALNNKTFLSETPDAAIQRIISGGVPGTVMPAWGGRLTEADIAAITAYLRSLEPTAPAMAQTGTGTVGGAAPQGVGPVWQTQ